MPAIITYVRVHSRHTVDAVVDLLQARAGQDYSRDSSTPARRAHCVKFMVIARLLRLVSLSRRTSVKKASRDMFMQSESD